MKLDFGFSDVFLNVTPPILARKVDRGGHWDRSSSITTLIENVFSDYETGELSLWRIEDHTDLIRISIALNENRSSLTEKIFLLPILPEELKSFEISQTHGNTSCCHASRCHHDAKVETVSQIEHLVRMLLDANRDIGRMNSNKMKQAKEVVEKDGCHVVVVDSDCCSCEDKKP